MSRKTLPGEFDLSNYNIPVDPGILASFDFSTDEFGYRFSSVPMEVIAQGITDPDSRARVTSAPYSVSINRYGIFLSSTEINNPNLAQSKLQMLGINFDSKTGMYTRVFRNSSEAAFKVALADFSEETIFGQIRKVLDISEPTDQDRQEVEAIKIEAINNKQLVEELKALGEINRDGIYTGELFEVPQNTNAILKVAQNQSGWANSEEVDYITTSETGPCFILSIYDQSAKSGSIAHIDALGDAQLSFKHDFYQQVHGKDKRELVLSVAMMGGDSLAAVEMGKIYGQIKKFREEGYKIDLGVGSVFTGQSTSLALDLRNGGLLNFTPDRSLKLTETSDFDNRAGDVLVSGKKPVQIIRAKK